MSKTKPSFSLYGKIFVRSVIFLILILESFSIVNFRGVVTSNIKRLQKLNDVTLATIPHPSQAWRMNHKSFIGIWPTSTPLIIGSMRADAVTTDDFAFGNASVQSI